MARKATKKAKKAQRPEMPGRFVPGYDDDDASHESVSIAIDDVQLHRIADEMKLLGGQIAEKSTAVKTAKDELAPLVKRHKALADALTAGTLEEGRTVYKFADDEKGTVSLYDAVSHELLETRKMNCYERQEEMDFEDRDKDGDGEAAEEAEPAAAEK